MGRIVYEATAERLGEVVPVERSRARLVGETTAAVTRVGKALLRLREDGRSRLRHR